MKPIMIKREIPFGHSTLHVAGRSRERETRLGRTWSTSSEYDIFFVAAAELPALIAALQVREQECRKAGYLRQEDSHDLDT